MSIIDNPGIPTENPGHSLDIGNHLTNPIALIRENAMHIKNHACDGALIGMAIAGQVMIQEIINNTYNSYVVPPEATQTCYEPNRLRDIYSVTVLTGVLVHGVASAIGLHSRLCAAVASTIVLCAGLYSQNLDLDVLAVPATLAHGLIMLDIGMRGMDRLRDAINFIL